MLRATSPSSHKASRSARVLLLVLCAAGALGSPISAADELTVDTIMGRDFVGTPPEEPAWSDDGRSIVYRRRRPGSAIVDRWRVELPSGKPRLVEPDELARLDAEPGAVESRDRRLEAFIRDGDVYVYDRRARKIHQVTRTVEAESQPLPLEGGRRVSWRRGDSFYVHDLSTGQTATLAELRLADDPETERPSGFLAESEQRLFAVLAERRARREQERDTRRERCAAAANCPPEPWYLGAGQAVLAAAVTPDGARLAVVRGPQRDLSEELEQGADGGRADRMPVWVTESSYVEVEAVRPKVGTGSPETPRLLVLDLAARTRAEVDLSGLPGLREDPLAELRRAAQPAPGDGDAPADATLRDGARVVSIENLLWNDDSTRLAVQLFSYDNKDRWIAVVEAASAALTPLVRIHDPAWVGWRFNDFGWMPGGRTLWYLSEESGWSQLWLRPLDGPARQLTVGPFEIDAPRLTRDGRAFIVEANRDQPGVVEIWRVDATTGEMTALTAQGGLTSAVLSPDEKRLLLTVSTALGPPELYVQEARPGAVARRLTETVSAEFTAVDWARPEFVAVPSRHGAGKIHGRLYKPADWTPDRRWPAVMFVHGAGYLQNAHRGWSSYYREFMFHTLLTRRGYVVLDLDYRASAGYGRAWRTAIYRQMGTPEVEDLADGVAWLIDTQAVDAARVGVYGGSYGGFLTFMAMFRQPELFAAGAALRPVSDWAHYNHGYTSNILNTPEVDPEAYRRSSPIEFAEGLQRPLLICHGMVDDNVVFQDTVRLVQRLIELGKTEWFETAIYPVEPHGFREPSSWTDEYKRILRLFEEEIGAASPATAVSAAAAAGRR